MDNSKKVIENSEQLKPKSFRIDDETAGKFKEISEQLGGVNQQKTMAKLIEVYEYQSGIAVMNEACKVEIEKFENYMNVLSRMFMNVVEEKQLQKEAVRCEYEAELEAKNNTIDDLRSKLVAAEQIKEETTEKYKRVNGENVALSKKLEKSEKEYSEKIASLENQLQDKKEMASYWKSMFEKEEEKIKNLQKIQEQNEQLSNMYKQKEKEVEDCKNEKKQVSEKCVELQEQLDLLVKRNKEDLAQITEKMNKELEDAEKNAERRLRFMEEKYQNDVERAALDKERTCQKQITKAQEQVTKALESLRKQREMYEKKYEELLKKMPEENVEKEDI